MILRSRLVPCPVETLAREHAELAEHVFAVPTDDKSTSLANARMDVIEEQATGIRCSSPGGALFQTVLIVSLFEQFLEDLPDDLCANRKLYDRACAAASSVIAYLEALSGEDRAAFSGEYVVGIARNRD